MLGALRRRLMYYAIFSVVFGILYTGIVVALGSMPPAVVWVAAGLAVFKDLLDEIRMGRGKAPIAFAGIEHTPSNLVLAAFLYTDVIDITGVVSLPGVTNPVGLSTIALTVLLADAIWDVSQDLREA